MGIQKLPKQTIEQILQSDYDGDTLAFLRDVEAYVRSRPVDPVHHDVPVKTGPVLIELKSASRTYKLNRKNTVSAVNNVDLTIQEGEIVALTGPSGSGKSTLMHLIAGLDKPSEGEVIVDGRSIGHLSEGKLAKYRNQTVGVVFQFFYLQPFLKVDRNIEVPLMFARSKRRTRAEAIQKVVDAVSLTDRHTFLPKELSGGQMQRVAIARALVNKPKILLADEPTGNLDSKNSDAIMSLLQDIRKALGTTMIIVTHDPRVAAWADRVIRLEDGRIVP
ncbi:MAG TPA: ABC transporter ATP-binding protein [Bacillota bacterium]|nr:ABC transporter ATP-binding protein [Bacillota bacterium]